MTTVRMRRAETVRSALDVISVCCVAPRVQLLLTDKIDMRDADLTTGVNIVLGIILFIYLVHSESRYS